jgi:uncharacterized protein YegP (UPF0339 family)
MTSFDIYEDTAGEFRWRVKSGGDIIADRSEGYTSLDGARHAVKRVNASGPDADGLNMGYAAFEVFEDRHGAWRWRLRHRNGNFLADSGEGYSSRSAAREGLESVKALYPRN